MAAILLDTTILIDLLRGREGAARRFRDLIARGDSPYTCAINVDEVTRGIRETEEESAVALFTGLRIVPLDTGEGRRSGSWRRAFAAQGVTLSQADCLVAAAAVGIGARLATGNPKDFPMPELELEHWPVGER